MNTSGTNENEPLPAPRYPAKLATLGDRLARIARLPRPLVFTNGVFDLLHRGHVTYLEQARQLGASLVVAVNADASVRRLGKGDARPLNPLEDRMAVLAALACVDLVAPFEEDTPQDLIVATLPDVLVKGGDYTAQTTAGAAEVIANGGRFVAIPFQFQRSTTALVDKILAGDQAGAAAFPVSAPAGFDGKADHELDARGLSCPLPILRTRKALSGMASGQTLRVLTTDPGSGADFPSFARQTGNALLAHGEDADGTYWFVLRRK